MKILHVRNLSSDVSEEQLKKHFSEPLGENGASKIAKVKKVKYNAFIEFNEREDAVTVMEAVNGTVSCVASINVRLLFIGHYCSTCICCSHYEHN